MNLLAVDTETTGTDWFDGARPFIATASDYDRDYLFRLDDPKDRGHFAEAIHNADALVFHNAQFDLHMIAAAGLVDLDDMLAKPIYDTFVIAKVILGEGNITGSHRGMFGLKELASVLVDATAGESEKVMKQRMKDLGLITRADQKNLPDGVYHELWKIEPELVETYAMMDTRLTYDLFQVLVDKINTEPDTRKRDGWRRALAIENADLPELVRMEHRGIALDREVVDTLYDEYSSHLGLVEIDLRHAAREVGLHTVDTPFNPRVPKDVVALLEAHGVVITEVTKHGQIKTDRRTLEAYEDDVPLVKTLLDYRRTLKFLQTYLRPLKDRDVVYTSINPVGADTGRMSSRRPNMQNVPVRGEGAARLRSMFVPRPGHCLISADYDRIEPVLTAWYMNDLELMEAFLEGDPYAMMRDEYYMDTPESAREIMRDKFKNGFLAVEYSSGTEKLAKTVGVPFDDAQRMKDSILRVLGPAYSNPFYPPIELPDGKLDWSRGRMYPGMPDGFVQRARKCIKRNGKQAGTEPGYVMTIGGSTLRLEPDDAYKAPNRIIQGSAAMIMKVAVARGAAALRPYDGHLLLPVHDELLAEVPVGVEHDAVRDLKAAMESCADLAVNGKLRLAVTSSICYNSWAEAK